MEKGNLGGRIYWPTRKGTSVKMEEEHNILVFTAMKDKARFQNVNWHQSATIKWH